MKNLPPLLTLLLLLTAVQARLLQAGPGLLPANPVGQPHKTYARGAATANELAKNLLQTIQENNFAGLNAFLLEEPEMVLLKNKGSEDMKAFLENTSVSDLQRDFRAQYQEIINQGISQTINWADYVVSEARLGKGTAKNSVLQPLTVVLTGKQNQPLALRLETVKINNRYFLFRQIKITTPDKL